MSDWNSWKRHQRRSGDSGYGEHMDSFVRALAELENRFNDAAKEATVAAELRDSVVLSAVTELRTIINQLQHFTNNLASVQQQQIEMVLELANRLEWLELQAVKIG